MGIARCSSETLRCWFHCVSLQLYLGKFVFQLCIAFHSFFFFLLLGSFFSRHHLSSQLGFVRNILTVLTLPSFFFFLFLVSGLRSGCFAIANTILVSLLLLQKILLFFWWLQNEHYSFILDLFAFLPGFYFSKTIDRLFY